MPPTTPSRRALLAAILAASLIVPAAADAHDTSAGGAAAAPPRPQLESLKCGTGERRACPPGEFLALRGEALDTVDWVVFLGRRGAGDNRREQPRRRSPHRVLLQVPHEAGSGPLRVVSRIAGRSTRTTRLRVTPAAETAPTGDDATFPVRGRYEFGTATNRFGGGRGHQGQDIFADCGTPVVAALGGEVTTRAYHARAGYYAVVTTPDGTSQAYMHLQRPAGVTEGEAVAASAPIGLVGETGAATGCHLHFELWTAPGWYRGGKAIDPLPQLRRWAALG